MNVDELFAMLMSGDRVENRSFSLRAKAFDASDFPSFARGAQIFDTSDSKLFLQPLDFLHRQSGNARQLDNSGGQLRAQLIQHRRFAGRVQLRDLLCERVTDPFHESQTVVFDQLPDILGQFGDSTRACFVCASFEVVAALQFEQRANLLQRGRDREFVFEGFRHDSR